MSVMILSDNHLSSIICYAVINRIPYYFNSEWKTIVSKDDCDAAIRAFSIANHKSYDFRYRTDEKTFHARFKIMPTLPALNMLKAVNCFTYQCCDYKQWKLSEAYSIATAIKNYAIEHLPGYSDADWTIE